MLLLTHPETCDVMNDEAWTMERRRGLRIRQNRPIKVYDSTTARYYGGQTCDVSSTGLRVEVPTSMAVRPGGVISVHVGLSSAGQALANRRGMIPARVVWVDRRDDMASGRMTLGVEFVASIAAHLDAA